MLKCFLLASSPLSANTFSKSCLEGNGRDFLRAKIVALRVQRPDRWADWWIFCIGKPRQGSGEITDCWATNPLLADTFGQRDRTITPTANWSPCDTLRRVARAAGGEEHWKQLRTREALFGSHSLSEPQTSFLHLGTCPACRRGSRCSSCAN